MNRKIKMLSIGLLLAGLILGLAACGGAEPAPAEPTAMATPVPPTNTPASPTNTPALPTNTPAVSAEPATETESIEDVSEVPWLKTYRIRMSVESSGEAFEGEEAADFSMEAEYVKEPPAVRMIIKGETDEEELETIQIEDQAWMRTGGQWMQVTAETPTNFSEGYGIFSITDIAQSWENLAKVGNEQINGVDTTHYHFDKQDVLGLPLTEEEKAEYEKLDKFEGDIYLADEGFVVRWDTTVAGVGVTASKPDASGEMRIHFEIYDLNADISIEPPDMPDIAEQIGADIPAPEGAILVMSTAGMVMYQIPNTIVQDMAEFYQKAFEDAGFTYNAESSTVEDTFGMMTFQKDDMTISLVMSPEADTISVIISTESQ